MGTTAAAGRHVGLALLEALLVAVILATALWALSPISAPAQDLLGLGRAQAARGSISVPDGVFGGTTVATVNPGGTGMWVFGACSQNGTVVWAQYARPDAGNQAVLGLGPTQLWTGGPASCTAEEGYFAHSGHWRTLAATTFNVTDPS